MPPRLRQGNTPFPAGNHHRKTGNCLRPAGAQSRRR
ncbi:hypothetical protein [Achromobacter phage CF418P1]|nr:hypothetical protein [Achromobacter phage CF418P1]